MAIWFYVILMAVIQGIAEFLPISSSGHLAILSALFGIEEDKSLAFGVLLHGGSLLAIVIFYRKVLLGFLHRDQWRLGLLILLATIPAGAFGLALSATKWDEVIFSNLYLIGFAFLITATLLRISEKPKLIVRPASEAGQEPTPLKKITLRQALIVGVAQMVAVLPGLSRSGTTISAGILSGVNREAAGTFSFLLAIPVIAGAALLHLIKLFRNPPPTEGDISYLMMAVGFVICTAVSYGALSFLSSLIRRGKLSWFSWYLYILGAAVLVWQLFLLTKQGAS